MVAISTLPHLAWLLVAAQARIMQPKGRTGCPEGSVFWPEDESCHRAGTVGPCPPGQVLTSYPQGPMCELPPQEMGPKEGFSGKVVYPEDRWRLPSAEEMETVPSQQRECLARDQVFWPPTRSCYSLLSQGPCGEAEWLVLEAGHSVLCRPRLCPCDPSMPDLCEVQLEGGEAGCRCRVALAAAQEGICRPGEQLLVRPSGYGECGCIQHPVHVAMEQHGGLCYPLYNQGPCADGFIVTWSEHSGEAACTPALCGDGGVKWPQDGECYELGQQGPCEPEEYLSITEDTFEPQCVLSRIKRVYDMIPRNIGLIKNGPLSRSMKLNRGCELDSRGQCRKAFFIGPRGGRREPRRRRTRLYVKRSDPRKYLQWLNSFRSSGR